MVISKLKVCIGHNAKHIYGVQIRRSLQAAFSQDGQFCFCILCVRKYKYKLLFSNNIIQSPMLSELIFNKSKKLFTNFHYIELIYLFTFNYFNML